MSGENQTEEREDDIDVEVESSSEPQTTEAPESGDDELASYSKNVQSRIKKLTEKYRKEERDREEATRIAQQLMQENQQLKQRMQNLDSGYLAEYGNRLESQTAQIKALYRQAYEAGDTEKMLEAQEQLSRLTIEHERLRIAKQRAETQRAAPPAQQVPTQAAPMQQPLQPPRAPEPDKKAKSWAEKNSWFGTDEVMTYAAFGIHRKLVEEEGFDPTSEDYYTEVDRRIRAEFPQKFKPRSGGAQVASAVASASRSTASQGRRTVRLTPSQVQMAKRLNVPLEEYAKYVKE